MYGWLFDFQNPGYVEKNQDGDHVLGKCGWKMIFCHSTCKTCLTKLILFSDRWSEFSSDWTRKSHCKRASFTRTMQRFLGCASSHAGKYISFILHSGNLSVSFADYPCSIMFYRWKIVVWEHISYNITVYEQLDMTLYNWSLWLPTLMLT